MPDAALTSEKVLFPLLRRTTFANGSKLSR
jgi:hypothetical protein